MPRPQVVAHRGASHDNAEHTLKAYLKALDAGADALECDVRLTSDSHLVCVHDRDLRRTAGNRGVVSTMELAELSELDFTSWKNPWAEMDDETEDDDEPDLRKVLTLRRLLETVRDHDRRVEVAIETKHPTRYGGLVERKLAEILGEFGWTGAGAPIRIMSFSYTALARMAKLTPDLPMVMLIERKRAWPMLAQVIADDWILGPGIDLLTEHPRFGRRLADTGRDIHVWTVNSEAQLQTCLDLGVKAVISDKPALMRDLLDGRDYS